MMKNGLKTVEGIVGTLLAVYPATQAQISSVLMAPKMSGQIAHTYH